MAERAVTAELGRANRGLRGQGRPLLPHPRPQQLRPRQRRRRADHHRREIAGRLRKSGKSRIAGLIKPGDVPPRGGLYLLDVVPDGEVRFGFPNISDNAEIVELIACGCHLICSPPAAVRSSARPFRR